MHWVDPVTLERHYAALSCNRVKGRHTFQTIAENPKATREALGCELSQTYCN